MDHLTAAVRKALEEENWFAALGLGLTLPDICGNLESPDERSVERRYVRWCNTYIAPKYTSRVGRDPKPHIFLSGNDVYALRCAVLHEGSDDIVTHRARMALGAFRFVVPPPGRSSVHCNQYNDHILQLQVDIFCLDICEGVDAWMVEVPPRDPRIAEALQRLMRITPFLDAGVGIGRDHTVLPWTADSPGSGDGPAAP